MGTYLTSLPILIGISALSLAVVYAEHLRILKKVNYRLIIKQAVKPFGFTACFCFFTITFCLLMVCVVFLTPYRMPGFKSAGNPHT